MQVTGLHYEGYGLLLRQSNFSAGVMYTLWISLGRERDPFIVLPCLPLPDALRAKASRLCIYHNKILEVTKQKCPIFAKDWSYWALINSLLPHSDVMNVEKVDRPFTCSLTMAHFSRVTFATKNLAFTGVTSILVLGYYFFFTVVN